MTTKIKEEENLLDELDEQTREKETVAKHLIILSFST